MRLIAALLLGSASALAQQQGDVRRSIDGVVLDSATRTPLAGATAKALDSTGVIVASVRTDGHGRFRFANLSVQPYALVITRVGYAERSERLGADSNVPLVITLRPTGVALDAIQVTASHSAEAASVAPVSVSVVSRRQIAEENTFTPVEQLRSVPGVDVVSTGLVQGGFSARASNGPSQGQLLMMVDYRNASLPSLGVNTSYLLPFTSEDLERIEIVRGPGAAIYGPDAHSGVVHFMTRSPFESQGLSMSVAGGERSVRQFSGRFARAANARIAFKLSGEYFEGLDWALPGLDDTVHRDRNVRRASGEARLDWRPDSSTTVVGTFGTADAINVVALTGGGFQLAKDWRSSFAQARVQRGALFANVTHNFSDAGHTYRLSTGAPVVDHSRVTAAQLQHAAQAGRVALQYGVDGALTDPRTGGTTHGDNEDNDRVAEIGGYIQAKTPVSSSLNFVTVVRVDHNDRLHDLVMSPRAALVYTPSPTHAFRLTYNRAYSHPDPVQLFRDIVTRSSLVVPGSGSFPYGVRNAGLQGGYTFRRDCSGLCMRSPFNPGGSNEYLPADATRMWASIATIMAQKGVDLATVPAPNSSQVSTVLGLYDLAQQGVVHAVRAEDVLDIPSIRRDFKQTLELGYRALVGGRLVVGVDGYRRSVKDAFGAASLATPSVFHDSTTLAKYLAAYLPAATATKAAGMIARIPVGTISPRESTHPVDLLNFMRQGGAYSLWGADGSVTASLGAGWDVTGSYSWISNNNFVDVPVLGQVNLNVPQNKGTLALRYHNSRGWSAALLGRSVGAFPGRVPDSIAAYGVVDAHAGHNLFDASGVGVSIDAYNLLNRPHREVSGGPTIGRMLVSRVQLRM